MGHNFGGRTEECNRVQRRKKETVRNMDTTGRRYRMESIKKMHQQYEEHCEER